MGCRDFDGTDDRIDISSHASIDGFTSLTIAFWLDKDTNDFMAVIQKGSPAAGGWSVSTETAGQGQGIRFLQSCSGDSGEWANTDTNQGTDTPYHVAITYTPHIDNDPVIYIDGTSETVNEVTPPTISTNSDSGNDIRFGEDPTGFDDFNGQLVCMCYDSAIWTAAEVNRHKWWGQPPGGLGGAEVVHPLLTDSLTNKGSGTANGTNTGTTMVGGIPRTERCWGSMMGVGR